MRNYTQSKETFKRIIGAVFFFVCGFCLFAQGVFAASAPQTKQQTKMFTSAVCPLRITAPDQVSVISQRAIPDVIVDAFFHPGEQLQKISVTCEFELADKNVYNTSYPLTLSMPYAKTDFRPHIYYWQSQKKKWISLPTEMNRSALIATADIHLPYAIIAVFSDKTDAYEGIGSWYADRRHPSGAATNLFPTGTKLLVTNLENNKSTNVSITSTWTQTNSQRVIDLVKTVFQKIASLSEGLIHVRIQRL